MSDDGVIATAVNGLDLSEKKKKKPKAAKDDELAVDMDLGTKKKKKTKKKDKDDGDNAAGDAAMDLNLDLSKKKKKKKGEKEKGKKDGKSKDGKGKDGGLTNVRVMEELDTELMAQHSYEDLLFRVFDKMESIGVGKSSKGSKKIVCKPPNMVRIGTKKSGYQNFGGTCEALNRTTKHVMNYILAETGTSGNLDMTNQLILRGRFKPAHMENILREYIKEYVQCGTCKSANTELDKIDRLTFMNCNDCSSRRTVTQMNQGYQAITGKRKKLREKQGMGTSNAMKN